MKPLFPDTKAAAFLEKVREAVPSLCLSWSASFLQDWAAELGVLTDEDILGNPVADSSMAALLRCGLLARADLFDEPHSICQEVPTATGSYWHGILHRREPDYGNSRYWFRRVGRHPVFDDIFHEVSKLAAMHGGEWNGEVVQAVLEKGSWDPFLFIDLCETAHRGRREDLKGELECLQELEIGLLLGYTYRRAVGDRPRRRKV